MITIIHGPKACGKTRNAAKLAAHFGAARVVDDWGGQPLQPGDLALTNCIVSVPNGRVTVIDYRTACHEARIMPGCACGNENCNGVRYRPAYSRVMVPCPLLASEQSSETINA